MGTIRENLMEYWDTIKNFYPENQILCLYRYGNNEKGFGYEVLYLPTYEELCCEKPKNNVISYDATAEISVRNIQNLFFEGFLVKSDRVSDLFSTPYFVVNPKYKKMFETCFRGKFAEDLLKETYPARMYYQALEALPQTTVAKTKDILNNVIQAYEKYSLKNKSLDEYRFMASFKKMICVILNISQKEETTITPVNAKPAYTGEQYLTRFTSNEIKALKAITAEIQMDGNISIVKMIQLTNISRPVFTNALNKLKEYKLAEVNNQGVKGTHIQFQNLDFFTAIQESKAE